MTSDVVKKLGMVIVVSGASGTGKSTIFHRVREAMPELGFSVSCTTRPPREGEQDGVDYYYISRDEFEKRIDKNEFIEYAEVFDNFYGTLRSEVIVQVEAGKDVFLDIDIQGALQIQQSALNDPLLKNCCEFIFIVPPSVAELEKRLRGRGSDSEAQISKRLAKAEHEISFWRSYDYLIVNDRLEDAVSEMENLIRSLRLNTKRMSEGLFDV